MGIKPGLPNIGSWILSTFFLRYSLTPYVAMFWEKYIGTFCRKKKNKKKILS